MPFESYAIWFCHNCGDGPFSMVINIACPSCGRLRDRIRAYRSSSTRAVAPTVSGQSSNKERTLPILETSLGHLANASTSNEPLGLGVSSSPTTVRPGMVAYSDEHLNREAETRRLGNQAAKGESYSSQASSISLSKMLENLNPFQRFNGRVSNKATHYEGTHGISARAKIEDEDEDEFGSGKEDNDANLTRSTRKGFIRSSNQSIDSDSDETDASLLHQSNLGVREVLGVEFVLNDFKDFRRAQLRHVSAQDDTGDKSKGSDQQQSSFSEGSEDDPARPSRKRTHQDFAQSQGGTGAAVSKRRCKSKNVARPRPRLLACPFLKYDRQRYIDCEGHLLLQIKTVTQHLRRRHEKPIHCPRCYLVFEDESSQYEHSVACESVACESTQQKDPYWERLTQVQFEELGQMSRKKKSLEEKWYAMFGYIFPDTPLPSSPYASIVDLGEFQVFQAWFDEQGVQRLHNYLRSQGNEANRESYSIANIVGTLHRLFDDYETARSEQILANESSELPAEEGDLSIRGGYEPEIEPVEDPDEERFEALDGEDRGVPVGNEAMPGLLPTSESMRSDLEEQSGSTDSEYEATSTPVSSEMDMRDDQSSDWKDFCDFEAQPSEDQFNAGEEFEFASAAILLEDLLEDGLPSGIDESSYFPHHNFQRGS